MRKLLVLFMLIIAFPMNADDWGQAYNLGMFMYYTGKYEEAKGLLKYAAKHDHIEAQYNLGMLYFEKEPIDYKKAFYWLYQAATQYDISAQFFIGVMYENGLGVEKDEKLALEWYKKSSTPIRFGVSGIVSRWEKRYASYAQYRLGIIYEKKGDLHSALKWLKSSAKLKNDSAIFELGRLYEEGRGVTLNYKKAAAYYGKAARKRYITVMGSKEEKAGSWHIQPQRIAIQNTEAQYRYGLMCHDGRYGAHDYIAARIYFNKAAIQGHKFAQLELGLMYKRGQGCKQDWLMAAQWLSKAANQGVADAQYHLATMLELGYFGLDKDSIGAIRYYEEAHKRQHKLATMVLQDRNLIPTDTVESRPAKRMALLIGNQDYRGISDLQSPMSDVYKLSEKLESLGFVTWPLINLQNKEMQDSISSFCKAANNCEVVLFFFAGHGCQDSKDIYLYPARTKNLNEIKREYGLSKVIEELAREENKNMSNIFIVDACRLPTQNDGEMNESKISNCIVQLSTGLYRPAADGTPSEHSTYMIGLLQSLDKPNLKISQILYETKEYVEQHTHGAQKPTLTYKSGTSSDIILNKK